MTSYEFFDLVLSGELGELDIQTYIEKTTNNYDLTKLELLLKDIQYCLFCEKEEKISQYSSSEIFEAIDELKGRNKEIPYKVIPPFTTKEGKVITDGSKSIDLEKLLYPYYFFGIYQLIAKINFYIKNANLPIKHSDTKKEQVTPTFTNNFDNIKPTEIQNHFKAGLVDKGYLTDQELNEYLKAAFELKTKPETLFKLKHTPTKQKIYTVFYVYYKDISQKKHERQKEYAALLGDYFEGYKTDIIQTNWARDYKTKR